MKGVPVGHKNGEGAKRRAKVHTFREKSENSQIGTVGPCFSPVCKINFFSPVETGQKQSKNPKKGCFY